jgi:hypothetical protein
MSVNYPPHAKARIGIQPNESMPISAIMAAGSAALPDRLINWRA